MISDFDEKLRQNGYHFDYFLLECTESAAPTGTSAASFVLPKTISQQQPSLDDGMHSTCKEIKLLFWGPQLV